MIASMNVSHFVKNLSGINDLHQLICRGVANFGTRCIFTDGSKTSDKVAAAAVFIPITTSQFLAAMLAYSQLNYLPSN